MRPGFKSRKRHLFFFFLFFFFFFFVFFFFFFDFFNLFIFCVFFLSLLLQCKFANSTLLSLLSFSYFITPYDAQASSAFSALINICHNRMKFRYDTFFIYGTGLLMRCVLRFRKERQRKAC